MLAVLLVIVGLYGTLSFFAAQRRNEIGIRIALGARRTQVISLLLRDTFVMLLPGVGLGIALALAAGRAAGALLFGLKAWDLATFAFAVVLLAAVALLASWIPALRASRFDPVAVLRTEEHSPKITPAIFARASTAIRRASSAPWPGSIACG